MAALLGVCASASAQFTNVSKPSYVADIKGWNTIYAEWNPSSIKSSQTYAFTGFSLGYAHAFNLSQAVPLFIETGIGVQYSFLTVGQEALPDEPETRSPEDKYRWYTAKVPVEILYAWHIPNSSVTIIPHAGINLKYNITGTVSYYSGDDNVNLFDKSDWGDDEKDMVWERFNIGWQFGVKARLGKKLMIGASYVSDFSNIWEAAKAKISGGTIILGYTF